MSDLSKVVHIHIRNNEYNKARAILFKELRKEPHNHWLLAKIGETYKGTNNNSLSLRYLKKAQTIAPNCPHTLWHLSATYYRIGEYDKSKKILRSLLRRGVKSIAFGLCGEGIQFSRSLLNDSRVRLALIYKKQDDIKMAIRYLNLHLKYRARGNASNYTKKQILKKIELLQEKYT